MNKILLSTKDKDREETADECFMRLKNEGIPETKITKLLESNKRTPIKTENVYNYDHLYPF